MDSDAIVVLPILFFFTAVLFVWAVSAPKAQSMEGRLRKHGYLSNSRQVADLNKSFSQRVILPLLEKLGGLLARITPERTQQRMKEKLDLAQLRLSPSAFLVLTAGLGIGLPLIILLP